MLPRINISRKSGRRRRVKRMSKLKRDDYRRKATERKRNSRASQRQETLKAAKVGVGESSTSVKSYRNRQSFGKGLSRAKKASPESPNKRVAVVSGSADSVETVLLEHKMNRKMKAKHGLSQETQDKVKDFFTALVFHTQHLVWMMLWQCGKLKSIKYYLTMFLREAHQVYSHVHADLPVKFSKFCSLRPNNVLLLSGSQKDQCKCMIHENLFLKLDALGIIYGSSFWNEVLCSTDLNNNCWLSK